MLCVSTLAVPSLFGRFTHAANYSTLGPDQFSRVFALPAHREVPRSRQLIVERYEIINAPPQLIYDVLADADAWPTWDPVVTFAETEAHRPLEAGDVFSKEERGTEISAKVLEAQPGRLLRWRGVAPGRIIGVHSYRLVRLEPERTLVVAREEFSHWALRLFAWATDLGIGAQFETTLSALKATAERRARRSAPP